MKQRFFVGLATGIILLSATHLFSERVRTVSLVQIGSVFATTELLKEGDKVRIRIKENEILYCIAPVDSGCEISATRFLNHCFY